MSAIQGTFVKIGTMADGTPRIVLDLQCTLSEVAAMGLIPGIPFALARITGEASVAAANKAQHEQKERAGELCIMACNFCNDPKFREWCGANNPDEAKGFILETCQIDSRKELDTNSIAKIFFHELIRGPFIACRDA